MLDGRTINCNENSHHKILEYEEHFRTIPVEEDLDSEYSIDDLVYHPICNGLYRLRSLFASPRVRGCTRARA